LRILHKMRKTDSGEAEIKAERERQARVRLDRAVGQRSVRVSGVLRQSRFSGFDGRGR